MSEPEAQRPALPAWIAPTRDFLAAVLLALAIGAVLIIATDESSRAALGYVTGRPSDFASAAWEAVSSAYAALWRGAVGSPRAMLAALGSGEPAQVRAAFTPLSESLVTAAPMILTGLAVTVPYRASLFNIGGEGQMLVGAIAAAWVGFALDLPAVVHVLAVLAAGVAFGGVYGAIPGLLRVRSGAHEVITTIMLNSIAAFGVLELLRTEAFLIPGQRNPVTPPLAETATLPTAGSLRLHLGIVLVLLLAWAVWWLVERSTIGFEIRAVGLGADAAAFNGMKPARATVVSLGLGGALAGFAGAVQVASVARSGVSGGIVAGLGFDGILVALLGRGRVGGTVAAALLFGAMRAGGRQMQAATQTPLDLVVVLQALIILFVAAPAFIRAFMRVRDRASGAAPAVSGGWGA